MLDLLRRGGKLLRLTWRKAGRDGLGREATALAFNTVLAFVPLLAAISFVGSRFFHQYRQQVLVILGQFLPYSESRLIEQIDDFLAQAAHLRGIGMVGFLLVAALSLASIESTLNRIWYVTTGRPWRTRLYSLAMLFAWGPVLIGAAYSILAVLRQRPEFEQLFQESWLLRATPLLVTWVGLTMLYWLVPYTAVRFRCALVGGTLAALALELLRFTFKLYLHAVPTMSLVYGGFSLALFFMVSIELAWVLVLLGSEVSYVAQHLAVMAPDARRSEALDARWLGLGAVAVLAERRAGGSPNASTEELANLLDVTADSVHRALFPLLEGGIVAPAGRVGEGYLLAAPPAHVEVESVLGLYESERRHLLEALPTELGERLEALRRRIQEARRRELGGTTFNCVLAGSGEPPPRTSSGVTLPPGA
ncbi:MAG: YhjD/YihY/BrkB family envelope integrity protein [Acidobacteriota bacterium]